MMSKIYNDILLSLDLGMTIIATCLVVPILFVLFVPFITIGYLYRGFKYLVQMEC
jgi:hypothetical protein